MPCPRCEAEVDARARSCPACAMPIAFGEEPSPAPLDEAIELDRRGARGGELALGLDPDLALTPDLALDPDPDLDRDLEESDRRAAAGGLASKDRGLSPLHRAAALSLDALVVGLAAALPIAIASAGFAPAPGGLDALALPAAGFAALVAVAYVLLSRALLGATLGRLAVERLTQRDPPLRGDPAQPLAVRAP